MEDMIGFSLEHQDDARIQVRHKKTGTTFAFHLVNGNPTGSYEVWSSPPELRSGASIDLDDADVVEALAVQARDAAVVLQNTDCSA